jgi:hypothetical protein
MLGITFTASKNPLLDNFTKTNIYADELKQSFHTSGKTKKIKE